MIDRRKLSDAAAAEAVERAVRSFQTRFRIPQGERDTPNQRVQLLWALLAKLPAHALKCSNPCVVAGQQALEDFAYDFWAAEWRQRGGANNNPIQDSVRKLLVNWRVEVVGDQPTRKREWLDPAKTDDYDADGDEDGFWFSEIVNIRDGQATVTIDLRREEITVERNEAPSTVLVMVAQVAVGEMEAPGPNPVDRCVILRAGSLYKSMEKAADMLEAAFIPLEVPKWERIARKPDDTTIGVFRRVIDYSIKMKRAAAVRGFVSVGLLVASLVLFVIAAVSAKWYYDRVEAVAGAAIYVLRQQPACIGRDPVVELRAVVPVPSLPWVLLRDGEIMRSIAYEELQPLEVTVNTDPLYLRYPQNFRFVDDTVRTGESHRYELAVRLPFGRLHRPLRDKGEPSFVAPCR